MGSSPHNYFFFLLLTFNLAFTVRVFNFDVINEQVPFSFPHPQHEIQISCSWEEIMGFFFLTFFSSRRLFCKSVYFHFILVLYYVIVVCILSALYLLQKQEIVAFLVVDY